MVLAIRAVLDVATVLTEDLSKNYSGELVPTEGLVESLRQIKEKEEETKGEVEIKTRRSRPPPIL